MLMKNSNVLTRFLKYCLILLYLTKIEFMLYVGVF